MNPEQCRRSFATELKDIQYPNMLKAARLKLHSTRQSGFIDLRGKGPPGVVQQQPPPAVQPNVNPETREHDHWLELPHAWVRMHLELRKDFYSVDDTSGGSSGGPNPADLTDLRKTTIVTPGGNETVIEDLWTRHDAHKTWHTDWIGKTQFTKIHRLKTRRIETSNTEQRAAPLAIAGAPTATPSGGEQPSAAGRESSQGPSTSQADTAPPRETSPVRALGPPAVPVSPGSPARMRPRVETEVAKLEKNLKI